jgi:hypothetical protein
MHARRGRQLMEKWGFQVRVRLKASTDSLGEGFQFLVPASVEILQSTLSERGPWHW